MKPNDLPETCFAQSGDVNIAYQVMGEGPLNLVVIWGMMSHVEFMHELPGHTDFLRRLSRFACVVIFDKRGQGLSDRVLVAPTLEARVDDARAVMDALNMERAVFLGVSEGTAMSAFFAATHPDRVSHLALYGGFARYARTDGYPIGRSEGEIRQSMTATGKRCAATSKSSLPASGTTRSWRRSVCWRPFCSRILWTRPRKRRAWATPPGSLVERHRGRLIKTTGDGILAMFDGPGCAVRCALAMEPALTRLNVSVRAGLHTGEVEERGDDIGGIAVHAASRVMSKAGAGEVLVSRVVADLVGGSGLVFADRGDTDLKGIPGTWRLLAASL